MDSVSRAERFYLQHGQSCRASTELIRVDQDNRYTVTITLAIVDGEVALNEPPTVTNNAPLKKTSCLAKPFGSLFEGFLTSLNTAAPVAVVVGDDVAAV